MRKLVLGIALVITLDLAFIFSVKVEKNTQLIARAARQQIVVSNAPITQTPMVSETNSARPDGPEIAILNESETAGAERTLRPRSRQALSDVLVPEATPQPRYAPYRPAEKFEDTIIYVAKVEYVPLVRPEPVSAPPPAQEKQAAIQHLRKKRSGWSRTYHVIKKPYDWVRSAIESL